MIYKKTATIWCRSSFRLTILRKPLLILLLQVFLTGSQILRAADQILVGELIQWDLKLAPDSQKFEPVLNPRRSGILHSQNDDRNPQINHVFLVPNQAGNLVIELPALPNSKKQKKIVEVKPWPLDPPSTGIRAGVGKISGHWIHSLNQPEVGETIQFTLKLEGDAAIAIRSAPELVVMHSDSMIGARSIRTRQSWPVDTEGSYQSWTYEVSAVESGHYQVQPLRIHTWDKLSQSLQTKLISGISWEVAPRPTLKLETTSEPASQQEHKPSIKKVLPLIIGVLTIVFAVVYRLRHLEPIRRVKLRIGLYRASGCMDQDQARVWYRKLKPLWPEYGIEHKKSPPRWRAVDQSRMDTLERLAYGKPVDQNPIR